MRYEMTSRYWNMLTALKAHAVVWYQDRGLPLPRAMQGLSVRDLLVFAYEQYQPTDRLAGKLLLIRATQGDGSVGDLPYQEAYEDALLGWRPFCEGAIAACDVPGGHSTMLNDENVSAIATAIESMIEQS